MVTLPAIQMDHFSLLGVARHPWLEPEDLKEKFHALSAQHHPDVHATGSASGFERLNAAYQTLRDPVRRLKYLLELEAPQILLRKREVPADLIALFMETGAMRARIEKFVAKHAQATAALARALLAAEKTALI